MRRPAGDRLGDAVDRVVVAERQDLDPRVGRERRADRERYDRLEAERDDFHERVRAAFLALAAAAPERFVVVDAALPEHEVAARIRAAVEPRLDA